jgi:hypothetical protein
MKRTRRQKKSRKQRKSRRNNNKLRRSLLSNKLRRSLLSNKLRRSLLSNKLRGGDLGNPTILTLEGVPLPSNAVVVLPTSTQTLQDFLSDERSNARTGDPDDD